MEKWERREKWNARIAKGVLATLVLSLVGYFVWIGWRDKECLERRCEQVCKETTEEERRDQLNAVAEKYCRDLVWDLWDGDKRAPLPQSCVSACSSPYVASVGGCTAEVSFSLRMTEGCVFGGEGTNAIRTVRFRYMAEGEPCEKRTGEPKWVMDGTPQRAVSDETTKTGSGGCGLKPAPTSSLGNLPQRKGTPFGGSAFGTGRKSWRRAFGRPKAPIMPAKRRIRTGT